MQTSRSFELPTRRTRVAASLALNAVACSLAISLALAAPAWAYVDPSVMTYTIQALAGVAVALSAVAGVAFRRGRKRVYQLLDVDEDARKQREPDVYRIDSKAGEGIGADIGCSEVEQDASRDPDTGDSRAGRNPLPNTAGLGAMGWKPRFVIAFAVCLFASVTLFVLAPLEIVAASAGSLVYSAVDVAPLLIVAGILLALAVSLVVSLLKGRLFGFVVLLVFALALGAYLQALFLNIGLPPADGKAIDWASFMPITVVSTIVWLAVLVGVLGYGHIRPRRAVGAACLLACALVLVQGVGAASLLVAPADKAQVADDGLHAHVAAAGSPTPMEDGLFEVAQQGNIIVFVLDTFDTAQLEKLVADDPSLLDEMGGFTWFKNATGSMIPTRYAVPSMLTGQVPRPGEKFSTYLSERYLRSSFLQDLHAQGVSIGLYSDSLNLEYLSGEDAGAIARCTMNLHAADTASMNLVGTWFALAKCALYRDVPWLLKPPLWFYTDEINLAMVAYDPEADPSETTYLMNDVQYFKRLQRFGLSIEQDDARGAFRFIHLIGPHEPFNMNERAEDVGLGNSDADTQARGSLFIVDDYLRRLKELGVYDDATIIITADHGVWFSTLDPLEKPSAPILLVKPAQTHDEAQAPVVVSNAAVGHFELPATIMEAAGGDPRRYGTPVFSMDPDDVERPRMYYATTNDGWHDQEIVEYAIAGDPLDTANWKPTGEKWAAQE
ncbi:MAG: arylsulfatase [Eggerthellaceae bacterium]|nr:arylsulfatase [Eggerthellaceae bacterium]